jgi:hypothetical protein
MKIGSLIWRFKNYGVAASFKYLYTEKLNKKRFDNSKYAIIVSLTDLNNKLKKLSEDQLSDLDYSAEQVFDKISEKLMILNSKGNKIKESVIGLAGSKTRLKTIAYILKTFNLDIIIESGTQHGVSALFIEEFIQFTGCSIYSIDIKPNVKPEGVGLVNYVILKSPVRKSFKSITREIVNKHSNILFFHDSDHSYENMMFEFNWAWNELKVDFLISDDVSENMAFSNFTKHNNLTPYYCKFDSGSVVGFAIRSQ